MAAGNAKGKRIPTFANRKSKNPRCFKGVKRVPCRYRAQKKSWMLSELFEEWVKELGRNFGSKKRKIALIIDNCPAHLDVPALEWVELTQHNLWIKESSEVLKPNIIPLWLKNKLLPWRKEASCQNFEF